MLFDVAALVIASVALGGATGAFVVPEVSRPGEPTAIVALESAASGSTAAFSGTSEAGVTSAPVTTISTPELSPDLTVPTLSATSTAAEAVDESLLPRLGGRALLDQLALLSTRDITSFVSSNPDAVSKLLLNPPSAKAVSGWWSLVPDDARDSLIAGVPELIGNLDGLPVALRDDANRVFLRQTISTVEDSLPSLGRAEEADAGQRLHMLKEIEESLVTAPGEPQRSLLSVDTAWPGRAAVVVGDLQTADYVSYMVPGMFFTVDGQMVDWTIIAQDLYDEQVGWTVKLAGTDPSLVGKTVATVAWIGYQTPGITDIASLDLAKQGAQYISSAVHGVLASRTGDEPYVTLVTHSYGSTAVLMALADGAVTADSLVIIGSPGSAAQTVDDIGMPADKVFVGEAAWDPVVNSAFFGSDPGSAAFGASKMNVAGGTDPLSGKTLAGASGHLGYFDAGTEAMRNMALVGLDQGALVTDGTSTPGKILANRK